MRRHCKFEKKNKCRYDHSFDCGPCENLKHIIDEENKKFEDKEKEHSDTITKMAKELAEAKKEIRKIKHVNLIVKHDKDNMSKELRLPEIK